MKLYQTKKLCTAKERNYHRIKNIFSWKKENIHIICIWLNLKGFKIQKELTKPHNKGQSQSGSGDPWHYRAWASLNPRGHHESVQPSWLSIYSFRCVTPENCLGSFHTLPFTNYHKPKILNSKKMNNPIKTSGEILNWLSCKAIQRKKVHEKKFIITYNYAYLN